jgi:pyruvate kinase
MKQLKKTKIIATVWPATDTKEKIEQLYQNWANIIRMNYSHSNYDYFSWIIKSVKELNSEWKTNLWLLTDTKGPEIRTKSIEEKINIDENEVFILTTINKQDNITNTEDKKVIVCDYEPIIEDLPVWHIIDIDTGLMKCEVIEKTENSLICKAKNKHTIWSKRHLNLPWIKIKLPGITENDKKDIEFAVSLWTDFIALSFVRNKENILELREYLKEIKAPENIQIISKIENQEALDNLDEIIEHSDWIMIARWDLWAEVPYETLPIIQRDIANKCKQAWKYFIVATQMLESMIDNPIPTRAEVTDLFNAVMQKADCTMLSWETAAWKYPIEAVKTMKNVLKYSETQIKYKHDYFSKNLGIHEDKKQLIKNAIYTAENINAKAMLFFTKSWFMAKTASAFRPNLPVFTFTYSDSLLKKLVILFGLKTFIIENKSNEENISNAIQKLKEKNLVENWDRLVTVYWIERSGDIVPSIQVITIK